MSDMFMNLGVNCNRVSNGMKGIRLTYVPGQNGSKIADDLKYNFANETWPISIIFYQVCYLGCD